MLIAAKTGTSRFDFRHRTEHLLEFGRRHLGDGGSLMRPEIDQSGISKLPQRLPDGCARNAKLLCERLLVQVCPWRYPTGKNRIGDFRGQAFGTGLYVEVDHSRVQKHHEAANVRMLLNT